MTASAVAIFIVGIVQPFAQELIVRNKLSGRSAQMATLAFSIVLGLLAVWVTGGLAGGQVPAFSALDPSPLLAFLVAKLTPVYALSQLVFGLIDVPKTVGTAT